MEMIVLDEELKTAMRLLGARNIGELGLQHVSTYEPISEASGVKSNADVGYISVEHASVAATNLRRPFSEALEHKPQYPTVWPYTSSLPAFSHDSPAPLLWNYDELLCLIWMEADDQFP